MYSSQYQTIHSSRAIVDETCTEGLLPARVRLINRVDSVLPSPRWTSTLLSTLLYLTLATSWLNMHHLDSQLESIYSRRLNAHRSIREREGIGLGSAHNLLVTDEGQTRLSSSQVAEAVGAVPAQPLSNVEGVANAPADVPSSTIEPDQGSSMTETTSTAAAPSTISSASSPFNPDNSAFKSKSPPFYIGIALGCVVVCALIASIIAWYIRTRRRKRSIVPPWARNVNSVGTTITRGTEKQKARDTLVGLGILIDEEIAVWEPRGDRDAGEPKQEAPGMYTVNLNAAASDPSQLHNPHAQIYVSSPQPIIHPSPTSHNGTLQSLPQTGLGPLQVTNVIPGECTSLASSNISTQLLNAGSATDMDANTQLLQSRITVDEYGTPRETLGAIKPRHTTVTVDSSSTAIGPDLPDAFKVAQQAPPQVAHKSWFKTTFDSLFTPRDQVNEDKLTPAPQRHAPAAPPLLPTHRTSDDIEFVGGDLVGTLEKPARACTRKRDRGRDFQVGRMGRPVLPSRASSVYSAASLARCGTRRSVGSFSSTVYSYYGYPKPATIRANSSSPSRKSPSTSATSSTAVSRCTSSEAAHGDVSRGSSMTRSSSKAASRSSSKRSRIPRRALNQGLSRHGSATSTNSSCSTNSRIPVRRGKRSALSVLRSMHAHEEGFARKALLERRMKLNAARNAQQ